MEKKMKVNRNLWAYGFGWLALAFSSAPAAGISPRDIGLAVNRDSHDIAVYDTRTDKIVARVELPPWSNPHMAVMSPDGKWAIATGTKRNETYLVDVATWKIRHTVPTGIGPEHLAVSPDSKWAYINNIEEGSVSVVDLASGEEIRRLDGFFDPHNPAFLPDGSKVYIANIGAHEVTVIDAQRHAVLRRIQIEPTQPVLFNPDKALSELEGIANVAVTPDGRWAFAADQTFNVVAVIDTRTDSVVKRIPVGDKPWWGYISPDGRVLVVPNNGDNTVSFVDVAGQKEIARLPAGSEMSGVNFLRSPDGGKGYKAYVISAGDSSVYVYSLSGPRPAGRIFLGKKLRPETAATASDGSKMYLSCSTNGSIYVIGSDDSVRQIPGAGQGTWGTHVMGGRDNYCH